MKVLILAAGQGDRLEHRTDDLPKALVKVCGTPLICYQLAFLDHPKINKIGVVAGYHGDLLKNFLRKEAPHVQLFENPRFDQGSLLTLQSALSFLDEDCLLMNVDHLYPRQLFRRIDKPFKEITALCDFDRKLVADDMKILKHANGSAPVNGFAGTLADIHKELKNFDGGYIGLTFIAKSKLDLYKNALTEAIQKEGTKSSVEMILRTIAKSNQTIHIADSSGIRWLEIDTLEDLAKAEAVLKADPEFLS